MAIDPNAAQEVTPGHMFGGILPEEHPVQTDQTQLAALTDNVSDEPPIGALASIRDDSTEHAALTGKPAEQRAAKAHFAMGDQSPGMQALTNGIKNQTEDALRESAAVNQDIKDRSTRLQVIREKAANGGQITPEDVGQMAGLAKFNPQNNPQTIWEKLYANHFVNSVMSLGNSAGNFVTRAFSAEPELVASNADIAHNLVMRQEIAKTALEDMEARAHEQSTTGWAVDLAKGLVPGYSWFKTYDAVTAAPTSGVLKGSNLQDQISYLYSLPPDEMHKQLRGALDNMSKDNPGLAAEFAKAVVHYAGNDALLDNVFAVGDLATVVPVGKVAQIAAKGARGLKSTVVGTEVAEDAAKTVPGAYKAAVKANTPTDSDAGAMLSAMGDVPRASSVNTQKRFGELFGKYDPLDEGRGMSQLPTLLNPEEVVKRTGANLSATQTDRLLGELTRNRDKVLARVQELTKVDRLPEEALQVAIKETQDTLKDRYNYLGDAVLDYSHVRPEETASNVGSVTARLGKTDGSLFEDLRDAYQTATQDYKLTPGSFSVDQTGVGYSINVTKHLDETTEAVRSALLTTENETKESLAGTWLGFLRTADDRVSQFQNQNRKALVYGSSGLVNAMKDMAKDVGTLSRKEGQALRRIMEKNKYDLDPATGERGVFYADQAGLEADYSAIHGRMPSYKESKAYWTFVQINDLDWTMRNLGVFRDRARLGIEKFKLFDNSVDETGAKLGFNSQDFNGKLLKDLDWSNPETAGMVIHTKGQQPEYLRMSPLNAGDQERQKIKALLDDGYKLIQTENPVAKVFGDRFGNDRVNFVLTKDFENSKLDWKQIPYRPGFHTEYPQPWFVKQPMVRQAGEDAVPRNIYEGDTAALGFNTETEATKYAQRMDYARKIVKGDIQEDLGAYLSKNLPWNEKDFRRLFEKALDGKEAQFSLKDSFLHAPAGQTLSDYHGRKLASSYENFEDNIRSTYNMFSNVDKKFVGQRDNPLWTIAEKGTELSPVHELKSAREVDPFVSVTRGMSNVMRNRYFADYKIQAVEQWIQEYGDLLNVPRHELMANPSYYIHNGEFRTGLATDQLKVARNSRNAIAELLGTPSETQKAIEDTKLKLVDSIYNVKGQAASDKSFEKLVGDGGSTGGNGPMALMRSFAFHTKIGLFTPVQMFQNAATSANAIAIAPAHGMQGFGAGVLMQGLRLSEDAGYMDRLAKIAGSVGYKPEWFKESYAELKKTGMMVVDGEHAWRDDMADPKFFKGTFGQVLDKGTVFFKEGERVSRLTSWNTAFREWRTDNPTAEITNAIRNQILNRADMMNANMTRASQASWQQGIWSVPTQFWGYNARIMEQMVGGRMSKAETARAMAVYAGLYGVPVGALGSVVGGVINPYEDIRKAMLDKGWNVDDKVIDAFHSGLLGMLGRSITGAPTNISEKLGPGGTSTFRDIWNDKDFLSVAFGASGSTTGDLAKTLSPVHHWAMQPFRNDDEKFPLDLSDVVHVLRNVKSVDDGMKYWGAMRTGALVTKNGMKLTPDRDNNPTDAMTQMEAVLGFLTGAEPRRVSDSKLADKMNKERDDQLTKWEPLIIEAQRAALQGAIEHDDDKSRVFQQRVSTLIKLGGYRMDEIPGLMAKVNKDTQSLIERVPYDFAFKKASPGDSKPRQDQFIQSKENK